MASDEPIGEVLTHVEDKVWRIWAVSLGLAFILGRFYYVQEAHTAILSEIQEDLQNQKSGLGSQQIQTETYQRGATDALNTLRERVSRLEDRQ
jgi:hypothetical protein